MKAVYFHRAAKIEAIKAAEFYENHQKDLGKHFVADHRKAFNGLCMLVVGSVKKGTGAVNILATANGLCQAETEVLCGSDSS